MPRDTRAAFLREIDKIQPGFAPAFEQAIQDVRSAAQLAVLEDAIAARDIEGVLRILQVPPQYFAALDDAITGAFLAGGAYALSTLPKKPLPGSPGPLVIRFQGRHPRAESWIKTRSSRLITEINETTRAAVRDVLEEAIRAGQNPRTTALALVGRIQGNERTGGIVGLHSRQVETLRR